MKKLYLHFEGSKTQPELTKVFRFKSPEELKVPISDLLPLFTKSYNNQYAASLDPENLQLIHEQSTRRISLQTKIQVLLEMANDFRIIEMRQSNLQPLLQSVQQDIAEKHYKKAKKVLRDSILTHSPQNPMALLLLADIELQNHRYSQARRHLTIVLNNDPTDAIKMSAVIKMAVCNRGEGRHDEAVENISTALNLRTTLPAGTLPKPIDIQVLLADALYSNGTAEQQQLAIAVVKKVLEADESNPDGLMLYAQAAADRGKSKEAMQIVLQVLAAYSKNEKPKQLFAALLGASTGLASVKQLLPPSIDGAPAHAFLATIAKDQGLIGESIELFKWSLEFAPQNVTYILNVVHVYEINEDYEQAFQTIQQFMRQFPDVMCDCLSMGEMGEKLTQFSADIAKKSLLPDNWIVEWVAGDSEHASVKIQGEPASTTTLYTKALPPDALDLLGIYFTLVKILFLKGNLAVLPSLVQRIEPLRSARKLHKTSIRNEHAYYACIAQLLSVQDRWSVDESNPIYVCGDSHTLATGWRSVVIKGKERVLKPALVTGLKHWHLRENTNFYPKKHFYNIIDTIPDGADVIFLFGEIDCREGILVAVEKDRYKNLEEGIEHTISIFIKALQRVLERKNFKAYIHPIVPVLNETRHIVTQYNRIFQRRITSCSGNIYWLDFFDTLLTKDRQLVSAYKLDGTHLHPNYLSVLESALNRYF